MLSRFRLYMILHEWTTWKYFNSFYSNLEIFEVYIPNRATNIQVKHYLLDSDNHLIHCWSWFCNILNHIMFRKHIYTFRSWVIQGCSLLCLVLRHFIFQTFFVFITSMIFSPMNTTPICSLIETFRNIRVGNFSIETVNYTPSQSRLERFPDCYTLVGMTLYITCSPFSNPLSLFALSIILAEGQTQN